MDDNVLLQKIQTGDRNAFDILAGRYYVPLSVFAVKLTGSRDVAEDIVQDAFIHIWEKRKILITVSHMRNYLYLITRNYSVDYLRSSSRTRPLNDSYKELKSEDISAEYIRTEASRLLYEAIDQLPPRTAEVIRLTLEGIKQEQIAEEMGITVATVKLLKSRGIAKLKEILGSSYVWIMLLLYNNYLS
ncbi:MAG: sigma-70 family RNA polymerase sigma factor [Rikenellaceae bacterium]|nr:sigma-70 family RNA polymerase sigma factor [Rikenellaceae bacterium]MCL2693121.1 sigma-70 family RNA polymerase sigma factor [Rikenellaceae bacterium]